MARSLRAERGVGVIKSYLWHLLLIGVCWIQALPVVASQAALVQKWQSQLFAAKQGGFYLKAQLSGSADGAYDFQVLLFDLLRKKYHRFTQTIDEVDGPPSEIWMLAQGKYAVTQISLVNGQGIRLVHRPKKPRSFVVKSQSLSNLGLWQMTGNQKQLKWQIRPLGDSYVAKGAKEQSPVAFVINGFNGLVQTKVGGQNRVRASRQNHSAEEARVVITQTRQIGLFYGLNLFKHNAYAQSMMTVLEQEDLKLRECYIDRLARVPELQGTMIFRFILSKQSQGMKSLKRTGGTLTDPKLVSCIYYRLGALTFPVNRNMIGEVSFKFVVQ